MEVTNMGDAFQFAIVGFLIVMAVLAIVAICVTAIMKLEPVLFKEKKVIKERKETVKAETVVKSDELDPMALVLITAAVAAQYRAFNIRAIHVGRRRDTSWSEAGRMIHHGSHVMK
ncbi:MAG: OadG family protein [Deferribacteraceae bacterium]|jgi:Na+-transporting methylmalonyl-CoA/oxaloacetate decarboxylase gamma subunit|nr:OadG family protein [Deferribacteraceae bacterium]